MSKKKHGLGRGLGSLLRDNSQSSAVQHSTNNTTNSINRNTNSSKTSNVSNTSNSMPFNKQNMQNKSYLELAIDNLQAGKYQPRREMAEPELEALADSIRSQGILQPIVIRSTESVTEPGKYEIIAGERRFRAAKLAGLTKVPVLIKEVSDLEAMSMALIENIQRENLNPLEEACALERLNKEFGLTHQEIADSIGKSRSSVTNLLRILTLKEEVRLLLSKGDIELGHAKVLLGLESQDQVNTARKIVDKKLSVRETEQLILRLTTEGPEPKELEQNKFSIPMDPDVRRLQDELSQKLGAAVSIQQGSLGKGKLVIQYHSLEELEGILAHIN